MKIPHVLVIVLSCVLAFASVSYLAGQARPAEQAPSAQSGENSARRSSSEAARPGGLEEAGKKEAEGAAPEEDKTAQFKQSPSVRWLARHTGLSLDGAYWLSFGINFLIVVVLVGLGLKSNLPAMFRNRTQDVQRAIEEARRASEDAGRRLSAVEERLSKLNLSISELQTQAEAESRAEEQRLWAAAEEEKRKIVQSAEQEIAAAANAARRELKLLAVELAMANAEKQIKVDTSQDKQLVRDFVEQLGVQTRNGSKG
jgi:F-type H+-transporting ATPase subunit b